MLAMFGLTDRTRVPTAAKARGLPRSNDEHKAEECQKVTQDSVVNRAPDVVFQTLAAEDGAVLLNLDSGEYHGLNPVGAKIWEMLESPMSEFELCRRIEEAFGTDAETAAQDVRSFVQQLVDRKLVHLSPRG
jgi:hypothetical protein